MTLETEKELEAIKYSGYQDQGIEFYDPTKRKILIIKLGAMGDVLRTTPILLGLKKKYDDVIIYWVTKQESYDLLKNNPLIDKILVYNQETILRIMFEKFDFVFNFEIDPPATLLSNLAQADKRFGYFFNERGVTSCYNKGAEYYLQVAFNDELKVKNRRSYQEMMFGVAEIPFENEPYLLEISDNIRALGENFLEENKLKKEDKIIGLNISAGKRWPSKLWSEENILEFIRRTNDLYKVLLIGGPEEMASLERIGKLLESRGIRIFIRNTANSLDEFIGLINCCSGIITTDSLGLHIALALKKKTIALFFSTIENEVIGNNLIKIQSHLNKEFFYSNDYNNDLANSITVEEVMDALQRLRI